MKKALLAVAFALLASTQAFAIAGGGLHYVMNTGSLKSDKGPIKLGNIQGTDNYLDIELKQESASGLQGIGVKLWLDIIPFVDVEATVNVAATRYSSTLYVTTPESIGSSAKKTDTIPLAYTPEAPYNLIFDRADPIYGVLTGDMSVLYPFDMIPVIRPYVGAGVSYIYSIPIVNKDFTQKVINKAPGLVEAMLPSGEEGSGDVNVSKAATEMGKQIIKTLKDESYKSGIGAHIMAGLRAKVPVIPIAAYVNGKYYIGGNTDSQFKQGFVLEVGGGLAL